MNGLLKKDMNLRIISVLFAVFLWFFVLDSSNPISSVEISIPLNIVNEDIMKDSGIIVKERNFPKSVSVNIKGRKDKISNFSSNDAEAILDLSKVNDVDTEFLHVDVYISENRSGVMFDGVTPRVISLELEKVGENPFPVKIITTGTPKENYKIIGVSAVPETVSIEATDSVINSIGEVRAFVDISDISGDIVLKKECLVFSKDGEEAIELDKPIIVDIKVEVAKEIPIVPNVKGRPARNYSDGIHKVTPAKALIAGPTDVVNWIDNIKTEVIDIENINESTTKTVAIELPSGVRLVDTPKHVNVDVIIEQLATKQIIFKKEDILFENRENLFEYNIEGESIGIDVTGNSGELDRIGRESLKPSIDVRGLGEGSYTRILKIVLPNTVEMSQNFEVKFTVKAKG